VAEAADCDADDLSLDGAGLWRWLAGWSMLDDDD
jgi:hypothetical protein